MYLQRVSLGNFRSFDAAQLELQKDLTVLVGENNGGKSNAIDAIRLLTAPLSGRREIYCEPTDVRFQCGSTRFELEAHFSELSLGQQGRLISATTDATLTTACFGLRHDGMHVGAKPHLWAGKDGKVLLEIGDVEREFARNFEALDLLSERNDCAIDARPAKHPMELEIMSRDPLT